MGEGGMAIVPSSVNGHEGAHRWAHPGAGEEGPRKGLTPLNSCGSGAISDLRCASASA